MAEINQAQHSRLMRLPAELKNQIYEEALEHDGVTRRTLSPQLLLTCKQIHREAQGILDGNADRVAIVRMETIAKGGNQTTTLKLGSASPIEVKPNARLDLAFSPWRDLCGSRQYLILYIRSEYATDHASRFLAYDKDNPVYDEATLVNQQLYLLATAVSLAEIHTVDIRVKHNREWSPWYNQILWPTACLGPGVGTIHCQGVKERTYGRAAKPVTHFNKHDIESSLPRRPSRNGSRFSNELLV
ncbi:hypothetical protein CLAFUW4_09580 [Fulvia fulva]|uniref:uncharacterized protein n=1 Tax=Passalora fulva TaxID=5499 RepID=UPI0004EA105E|nr:uncharacterized protein CLAFUR5_20280 [Fulvia fulva]KAK4613607.1 hypothetical protein CLAFUR4_09585 [Fulvia fulva]KAK4615089.1 hypothetical protein CLAFUR0_09576 [Fulvia fulva]WMI39014.1 hypothetical protein CLAFUR5_20280 [Fulvia fulva]WPV20288.1 hypothetical protein CLAFUW4_09580 [Fulvia fulva]WPV35240.1 hypothetical protein CLAFUW7_09581 [Fulvia fulva]